MRGDQLVLDPFSVVCKLAMLAYHPEGTKLALVNNTLEFSHRTTTHTLLRSLYTLFVDRSSYSRASLCALRKPIVRAIRWYSELAPKVFADAAAGLRRLIDIYEAEGAKDNAVETLLFCEVTMREHGRTPSLLDLRDEGLHDGLLEQLRAQWMETEVRCLEEWFTELRDTDASREVMIDQIDNFLALKESSLRAIIRDSSL